MTFIGAIVGVFVGYLVASFLDVLTGNDEVVMTGGFIAWCFCVWVGGNIEDGTFAKYFKNRAVNNKTGNYIGDKIEARVLEVDRENQNISIGIKQLSNDPWDQIDTVYKVGDLVTGKITQLASFGAFVGLKNEMNGLVHISQISEERVEKIKDTLEIGQEVTARVIKIDKSDRRIGLSIKAAEYDEDQLRREAEQLDQLKPGEDLMALEHAFDAAELTPTEEYSPESAAEPEPEPVEPEPATVNVVITAIGMTSSETTKVLKKARPDLGTFDVYGLLRDFPKSVAENLPRDEAEKIKQELEAAGCTVKLKQ